MDPKGWLNQSEPLLGVIEKRAVGEYLESGGWLTEHHHTRAFEAMIAEAVGSRHCIVLTNGTLTLVASLLALGVGPGDEVIIPDFTMVASANAVLLIGATPRLVDVERATLCLDLDLAERAITPHTKAIMLVSLNGRAPDMNRAVDLAERYGVHLVEDAAQAFGSTYEGRHLGTFGRLGSYSFSVHKIVTTGQGGAIVTDDGDFANRVRKLKDFGRISGGVDVHETIGFNFKFTDVQAVIGCAQMKTLPWRVARKREIFALYHRELATTPGVRFVDTDLRETCPWFVDVLVPAPDALALHLKTRGIGARRVYPPVHAQPAYGWNGDFPNSDAVFAQGLWLPSSLTLSDEDIRRVCAEVRAWASTVA